MALKFNPLSGNFDIVTDPFLVKSVVAAENAISGMTYLADSTGGIFTITLPSPTANAYVRVKDSGGDSNNNNITVARNAAESIDGVAGNYTIASDYASVVFVSDGTDWFIL